MRLAIPLISRPREHIDLCPTIVDVILARDVIACISQQRRQSVAKYSAARVANMQWACRVRGHVFHVHLHTRPHARMAKARARINCLGNNIMPNVRMQPEVQEPRPCHLGHRNPVIARQTSRQSIRNHTWRLARRLGQHHCRIRCHIAMRRIARRLHGHIAPGQSARQLAIGHHGIQRFNHRCANLGENIHLSGPSGSRERFTTITKRVNASLGD